jgi:hypothetical protein
MPNEVRGEIEITLGGEKRTLTPSFEAMAEIENRSGFGMLGLAQKAVKGNLGALDIASIIYGGLIGAGDKLSFEKVKELVFKEGIFKLAPSASNFLVSCLKGEDEEPQKKTKQRQ